MRRLIPLFIFLTPSFIYLAQIEALAHGPIPTDDLVLHLPMDEEAKDISPYAHEVQARNIHSTTGRFGKPNSAFAFYGENSQILVADDELLRLSDTDFTISLWMMEYAYNSHNNAALIVKRELGNKKGWFVGSLGRRKNLQGDMQYTTSGGSDPALFTQTRALSLHEWHHLVVIYQLKERKVSIYIDGDLQAVKTNFPSPNPQASANISIGFDIPTDMYALNGKLDEVLIFRRKLSYNEIQKLYRAD